MRYAAYFAKKHEANRQISGKELRKSLGQRFFYKVVRKDRTHRGLTYPEKGVIHDPKAWNPRGDCQEGGMYVTTLEYLPDFFLFGEDVMVVWIPDNARVWLEDGKFKVDHFEIREYIPISTFLVQQGLDYQIDCVLHDCASLDKIPEPNELVCKTAFQHGCEFTAIPKEKQTPTMVCMALEYSPDWEPSEDDEHSSDEDYYGDCDDYSVGSDFAGPAGGTIPTSKSCLSQGSDTPYIVELFRHIREDLLSGDTGKEICKIALTQGLPLDRVPAELIDDTLRTVYLSRKMDGDLSKIPTEDQSVELCVKAIRQNMSNFAHVRDDLLPEVAAALKEHFESS